MEILHHFTHFCPKTTHISLFKILFICKIVIIIVHICTVIIAFYMIILYFFSPLLCLVRLGIATCWVWIGYFDTRTRPAGLHLLPEPGPFNKRVFFPKLQTHLVGIHGPRGPRPTVSEPSQKLLPNTTQSLKKKKKKINFSSRNHIHRFRNKNHKPEHKHKSAFFFSFFFFDLLC